MLRDLPLALVLIAFGAAALASASRAHAQPPTDPAAALALFRDATSVDVEQAFSAGHWAVSSAAGTIACSTHTECASAECTAQTQHVDCASDARGFDEVRWLYGASHECLRARSGDRWIALDARSLTRRRRAACPDRSAGRFDRSAFGEPAPAPAELAALQSVARAVRAGQTPTLPLVGAGPVAPLVWTRDDRLCAQLGGTWQCTERMHEPGDHLEVDVVTTPLGPVALWTTRSSIELDDDEAWTWLRVLLPSAASLELGPALSLRARYRTGRRIDTIEYAPPRFDGACVELSARRIHFARPAPETRELACHVLRPSVTRYLDHTISPTADDVAERDYTGRWCLSPDGSLARTPAGETSGPRPDGTCRAEGP